MNILLTNSFCSKNCLYFQKKELRMQCKMPLFKIRSLCSVHYINGDDGNNNLTLKIFTRHKPTFFSGDGKLLPPLLSHPELLGAI